MRRVFTILFVSVLVCILTGCGSSKVNEFYVTDTPEGYERIFTIEQQASFLVPKELLDNAVELVQFDDDCDYDTAYLVQNDDAYIISSGSILYGVVKAKGSLPDTLEEYGQMFERAGLRLELEEADINSAKTQGVTKTMAANVSCMASLSSEYYNDFKGDMAVVKSDSACYGIYFGILWNAEPTDNLKKVMGTVTRSLILDDSVESVESTETEAEETPTPIEGGVKCEYRNEKGEIVDTQAVINVSVRGNEAEKVISEKMSLSNFDCLPELEDGVEWAYGELETSVPTMGMLLMKGIPRGSGDIMDSRVYILNEYGSRIQFIFPAAEGMEYDLAIGEKCCGITTVPFETEKTMGSQEKESGAEIGAVNETETETETTELSIDSVATAVAGYEQQFNKEPESEEVGEENTGVEEDSGNVQGGEAE